MINTISKTKRTAYVVSHTHWDREWRWPVWETRQMLMDSMDELIEVLEAGQYAGFVMDGQVIPLLDYMEMRPEMEERVKSLVTGKKLQIGPFRLDPPAKWHPEMVTPELLNSLWKTTDDSVLNEDRLMMNGCDYTAAQPMLEEMLEKLNEVDAGSNRRWVQATLPEFIELMREKIDYSRLTVVEGELREELKSPSHFHFIIQAH